MTMIKLSKLSSSLYGRLAESGRFGFTLDSGDNTNMFIWWNILRELSKTGSPYRFNPPLDEDNLLCFENDATCRTFILMTFTQAKSIVAVIYSTYYCTFKAGMPDCSGQCLPHRKRDFWQAVWTKTDAALLFFIVGNNSASMEACALRLKSNDIIHLLIFFYASWAGVFGREAAWTGCQLKGTFKQTKQKIFNEFYMHFL